MCIGVHPFIPAPNTVRARMIYSTPGGQAMNVLYFQKATPWAESDVAELTSEINLAWNDNLRPMQAPGAVLDLISAQDISVEDGFSSELDVSAAGTGSSSILPSNVTYAIKFGTGLAGRSRRGRMYWIGLGEADVLGDTIDPTSRAAIISGVSAFFSDVEAGIAGIQHVVVSFCNDGVWRSTAQVTPVASYSGDTTVDSQRRRLAGRGR